MKEYVCIGTYTEPILFGTGEVFQGKGTGVSVAVLENGRLEVIKELAVRNPSFLCMDEEKRKIYTVNEMKEYLGEFGGGVTQIGYEENGKMTEEQTCNTRGMDPCHIIQSPDRKFLSVANFASGSLTVLGLDEQGNLNGEKDVRQHKGSSVHPLRQKGPHAHSTIFSPDGQYLYVPDLGIDRVKAYRYSEGKLYEAPEADILVPSGSGPRFGEFGKDGRHFYLINEIGSRIMHFLYENGHMTACESIETLPPEFEGDNICSDLHITPDGKYLYASNRGHDSLVCCRTHEDGSLEFVERQDCGGKTPRNFAIDPEGKYLLVGNQDSDNITIFEIGKNGHLRQIGKKDFGSPVCIQFFKETVFIHD